MNRVIYILIILCVALQTALYAQPMLKVEVQDGSCVTIDGNAGLVKFRFYQNTDGFLKKNYMLNISKSQNRVYLDINELGIPVKLYTSSNKMALRDFFKMMEPEKYKTMDIQLNYVELPNDLTKNNVGNAVFSFKIKGVSKKYTMAISYSKQGDFYVFNSSKQINIKDFGLQPPDLILGLVKTNEKILVGLHFVLKITPHEI